MNNEMLVFGGPFDGKRASANGRGEYTVFPFNVAAVELASGKPQMSRDEAINEMSGAIQKWSVYVHELRDTGYGLHFVANLTNEQWIAMHELPLDAWPMWLVNLNT